MDLNVDLNGASRAAQVVFAGKDDLHFVNDWRKSLGDDQNPLRVDAVDFAQLAVYRFEAHSAIEPYAKSIQDVGDHIGYSPHAEVACFVLLTCDWFPDSSVIGMAHFRRTWSNSIVLDYLSAHPFIVRPPDAYASVVRQVVVGPEENTNEGDYLNYGCQRQSTPCLARDQWFRNGDMHFGGGWKGCGAVVFHK